MFEEGSRISIGWSGWASYEIELGTDVGQVNAVFEDDVTEAAIAFVFSVLPLVLPVWGIEPFHGSAVLTSGGALVILGPSRAGKSSLAAAFERVGFPLLADDTCAFDEHLMLWPGPAAINPRWANARQPAVGDYNEKKIRVPRLHANEPTHPVAVVVLEPDDVVEVEVSNHRAGEAFRGIIANARHGTFLQERRQALQFKLAAQLARLPLVGVRMDPSHHEPDSIVHSLSPWMREAGVATPGQVPVVGPGGKLSRT